MKNGQNKLLHIEKQDPEWIFFYCFLPSSVYELQQDEVMCGLTYTWRESDIVGVDACQSKVCDLDFTTAADQDVFWFEVTVQHHVSVQEVQSLQQLLHQIL